jgi:hypothetical protein
MLASGSVLVAGAQQENPMALQVQKVRVLRAFFYQGKTQAVGDTPMLPKVFALEMKSANKCVLLEDKPLAAVPAASPAPAADKPHQPESKGSSDAK